jgi:hypothetical protein
MSTTARANYLPMFFILLTPYYSLLYSVRGILYYSLEPVLPPPEPSA